MVYASAKYLRNHVKELLSTVENGEEVVVTYRGKAKAKLVPFPEKSKDNDLEKDPLFGIWEDNAALKDVTAFLDKARDSRYAG